MGDHAFADIGDDLEIPVTVHRKTGLRRDLGIGQHPHGAKSEQRRSRVLRRPTEVIADAQARRIDAS